MEQVVYFDPHALSFFRQLSKHVSWWIIFVFIVFSCKNKTGPPLLLTVPQVDSIVRAGFEVYHKNTLRALPYFIDAGEAYQAIDQFEKSGNAFLNVAGIYEEQTSHIDSAIIFAHKSLLNYQRSGDSMQVANLYKYYGYLIGINDDVLNGKLMIDTAIGIYRRHEYEEGVAVSQYNLARLAFHLKEFNKADSFLDEASNVWKTKNDQSRMFLINLVKLEIGQAISNPEMIGSAIAQCDSIILENQIPSQQMARFYELKEQLSTDHID